ncbi:unnamed protein product [Parnassius apollo]|uniref:(apollo) hypothetical protein n=1 Tax=Parnassius apollo TaxID=110799 RepID=A0A8S3WX24_PARAO|nr:unnamed protein product [Parnassius apollo]
MEQKQQTPLKKCFKCKSIIENRQFTICSVCNNIYHIDCANITFARFRIWTNETKKSWRCFKCIKSKKNTVLSPSLEKDAVNITIRKKRTDETLESNDMNAFDSESPNSSAKTSQTLLPKEKLLAKSLSMEFPVESLNNSFQSLEDLSHSLELVNELDIVSKQNMKIDDLQIKLKSCESELDGTILENNELRRQVTKLTQELLIMKNICKTPQIVKKQRKSLSSSFPNNMTPDKTKTEQNFVLENTIVKLQQNLKLAQEEVSNLCTKIESLEKQLKDKITPKTDLELNNCTKNHVHKDTKSLHKPLKHKLCILTSDKRYKILQNVNRNHVLSQYEFVTLLLQMLG